MKHILGISAFYHDSAAVLLSEGNIEIAVQEERFSRIKHDAAFPKNSINFILKEKNLSLEQIDKIVFYDKPFLKFERLIETYLANIPKGFSSFKASMPIWLREKLFLKQMLTKEFQKISPSFKSSKVLFSEHHFSHAASAFYASPYEKAVVLTLDGVGEWATTTVSIGDKNKLEIVKELHFPHSLGLLYSSFTYYVGFKVNSGEYKLMGLAPYGKPKYVELIKKYLVDIKSDGSFRMNQEYFNYMTGLKMINKKFENIFGNKTRKPNEKITQFHMDIASSIQNVTEEIILLITRSLFEEYKIPNLCLAGGVALNCVANGKIINQGTFKNIWIQPASGDSGGALGAAYAAWFHEYKNKRVIEKKDKMLGSYLGPKFKNDSIKKILLANGANFQEYNDNEIIDKTVKDLESGKAIGWFQGRMEFGPRALGCRSILADPRSKDMQKNLNLKVKFRESFRPFAPAVLYEYVNDWFKLNLESPYMLLVAEILDIHKKEFEENKELFGINYLNVVRSSVPAITHVDYSARIQTVHKETNLKFYNLIEKFRDLTGIPMLVNTSFNVRGEPIVCTPDDAFRCFMGTDIDTLIIENFYLEKNKQNKSLLNNYKNKFELD